MRWDWLLCFRVHLRKTISKWHAKRCQFIHLLLLEHLNN
ncbi:hypothetical protein WG66_013816, partial [Moniliophthora roreri]